MTSISLATFRMGQKLPVRKGGASMVLNGQLQWPSYQDYQFRDTAKNCRIRRWDITHNLLNGTWIVTKYWTTALVGEPHYIRLPQRLEKILRLKVWLEFGD